MRLSDIKGERTLDVIADIIDPIANIAEDEVASELFKREKLPEGMTANKFLLQRARKAAPALLKGHKGDIISILSTIEGTTPEAYTGTLNLVKLIKDTIDLLTDEAFTTLFYLGAERGFLWLCAGEYRGRSVKAFSRYVFARFEQDAREKAYRVYVTDVLKILAENTAKYSGGSYMKIRYYDLIRPKPEENRTPEEIIGNMKEKIARIGGGDAEPV